MNVKPNTDLIDKTKRLYKILEKETLNNYNNKTVIGGLDKLLEFLANFVFDENLFSNIELDTIIGF